MRDTVLFDSRSSARRDSASVSPARRWWFLIRRSRRRRNRRLCSSVRPMTRRARRSRNGTHGFRTAFRHAESRTAVEWHTCTLPAVKTDSCTRRPRLAFDVRVRLDFVSPVRIAGACVFFVTFRESTARLAGRSCGVRRADSPSRDCQSCGYFFPKADSSFRPRRV